MELHTTYGLCVLPFLAITITAAAIATKTVKYLEVSIYKPRAQNPPLAQVLGYLSVPKYKYTLLLHRLRLTSLWKVLISPYSVRQE